MLENAYLSVENSRSRPQMPPFSHTTLLCYADNLDSWWLLQTKLMKLDKLHTATARFQAELFQAYFLIGLILPSHSKSPKSS